MSFFSDDMGLVNVDLNKVSLDDVNFDNDDPETNVTFMPWYNRSKQYKWCKNRYKKN